MGSRWTWNKIISIPFVHWLPPDMAYDLPRHSSTASPSSVLTLDQVSTLSPFSAKSF